MEGDRGRYDVVLAPYFGSGYASLWAGASELAQFTFTRQAYRALLARLSPDGLLVAYDLNKVLLLATVRRLFEEEGRDDAARAVILLSLSPIDRARFLRPAPDVLGRAWNTPLDNLAQMPGARIVNYEPTMMLALDETCRLQCRLSVETRTNAYQIRTGQFPEAPISVYFTVRQYWGRQGAKTFGESYQHQRKILQELVDTHVVPSVVQPLNRTISNKQ